LASPAPRPPARTLRPHPSGASIALPSKPLAKAMAMYNPLSPPTEAHAFDMPFQVIKTLKRDFAELQAAFQNEQQQLAVEVQQLRQEVSILKEMMQKETTERKAICHHTLQDLTQLKSDKIKAVEEIKVGFASALHELQQTIADEIRDRQAWENLFATREAAEKSERIAECAGIKDELDKHREAFGAARDELFQSVNNINHDIEMMAQAMSKVSVAKGKLSKESMMCWRFFNGLDAPLPGGQ